MNVYTFKPDGTLDNEVLKTLSNTQCNVLMVTKNNIEQFLIENHALHKNFWLLTHENQTEYIKAYLMHFYGGGYTEIKSISDSWIGPFTKLYLSDCWVLSWEDCFLCKPNTPFTMEWYVGITEVMDNPHFNLKIIYNRLCNKYYKYII